MSTLISNIRGTTLRGCVNCTPSDSRSSFPPSCEIPEKAYLPNVQYIAHKYLGSYTVNSVDCDAGG